VETTRGLLAGFEGALRQKVALLARYFYHWRCSVLILHADRHCQDEYIFRREELAVQLHHQQEFELILRAQARQAAQCADRARRLLISRWAESEARLLLRGTFTNWQRSCALRGRSTDCNTTHAPRDLERLCLLTWRHLTAAAGKAAYISKGTIQERRYRVHFLRVILHGWRIAAESCKSHRAMRLQWYISARSQTAKHTTMLQHCDSDRHVLQFAAFAVWRSHSCSKEEAEEKESHEQTLRGVRGVTERLKTKVAWLRSKVQGLYGIIMLCGEGSSTLNFCRLLIRIWNTWRGAAAAVVGSCRLCRTVDRVTQHLVTNCNGWAVHASFLAWMHHWKSECRHHLHKAKDRIISALENKLKGYEAQKHTSLVKYAFLCGQNHSDPLLRYIAFRLWRRGSADGSFTDRSDAPWFTPRVLCRSEQSQTPSTWDFSPVSDTSLSGCSSMVGSERKLSLDQVILLALCLKDWRWQSRSLRHRRCRHDAHDRLKKAYVDIQQLERNKVGLHHQLVAASEEIELVTRTLQMELQTKAELVDELRIAWDEARRFNCRFAVHSEVETGSDSDAPISRSSSQQTLDQAILSRQRNPDFAAAWTQCEPGAGASIEFSPPLMVGTTSIAEQCLGVPPSRSAQAQSIDSSWIEASGITVVPPEWLQHER